MHARFLLGPAGSGKTFRCLSEIREELLRQPDGPPLIFIAPKQATFQLERQLLDDEKFADGKTLSGYTRLHIFSFERLAEFVLQKLRVSHPPLLSDEGRVMVLRALLEQKQDELKIFRASARMIGFVQQLSVILRDLQRHQLGPEKLVQLMENNSFSGTLRDKLHDLALLLRAYLNWLSEQKLQDANCLLDFATDTLKRARASAPAGEIAFSGLWLDGFAEMTPQEIDLLTALIPYGKQATLAFCLEPAESSTANTSWFSIWSVVGRTFGNCRAAIELLPGCETVVQQLVRDPEENRFAQSATLRHLEKNWTAPTQKIACASDALRVAICANAESEAILAAHEILKFVRGGGRYRDVAVLLRQLEGYHQILRRVFTRYGIPFFLDRRESVAHHPLAEVTRNALRTIAYDWRHDDWFGALKSGLVSENESEMDALENEALAHGWKGEAWFCVLKEAGEEITWAEQLRLKILPTFVELKKNLGLSLAPTGEQLAAAVRKFWRELGVEEKLKKWSEEKATDSAFHPHSAIHATVWEQMNDWLENLERAFAKQNVPLREWLPILDAGLSGLTVGVIPPAIDQVLLGTIDRSRNPDLKMALVLGLNETVFPAPPHAGNLLTEADRAELSQSEVLLGPGARELLGRERFFGYIACTRARERLVLTCAQRDGRDKVLNPSPFFSHLKQMFENLEMECFAPDENWLRATHACELVAPLIRCQASNGVRAKLVEWPAFASLRDLLNDFAALQREETLSPALAAELYGKALKTSVSRIEQFAACPFKFFVHSGLQALEREEFQLDQRERGSFQHAVLAAFHNQLREENKRWRDISPQEGRDRISKIAARLGTQFRDGLFAMDARARFTARSLTDALQDFVATLIEWMTHYDFDPCAVEIRFGGKNSVAPPWRLDLGNGHRLAFHGVIDRVDLCGDEHAALAVVIDYKSSARAVDPVLLANGIQIQLPAYLTVLRRWPRAQRCFGTRNLIPAGVFYVNLRGQFKNGESRAEVLAGADRARQRAYQHTGRFDLSVLNKLDKRHPPESTQFKVKFTKDNAPAKIGCDALRPEDFSEMLASVDRNLIRAGREIYAGNIRVDPYQHGSRRACEQCSYQSICRIDAWTHQWRLLKESVESLTG